MSMFESRIPMSSQLAAGQWHTPIKQQVTRGLSSLLIHILVVGSVILIWSCFSPETALFWGGILVAAGYIAIGIIEARYSPIFITPLSFYFLWYSIRYGLASIFMSSVIAKKGYLTIGAETVSSRDIAIGFIITLVGSLALHMGLQMLRPARPKGKEISSAARYSGALESLVVLWTVGLFVIYRPGPFKFLGLVVGILAIGPLAALLTLAIIPARAFQLSGAEDWGLLLMGTTGLMIVSLAAQYDSKTTLMLSVTPLLAAGLVRPSLRKYIPAALLLLALIYLLGVAPAVNHSRTMPGRVGMSPMERLIVSFERYSPLYSGNFQSGSLQKQENSFFERVYEPVAVGFTAELVRSSGLKDGATMSNLVYGFIPRILWPGKPKVNRGTFFTAQVGMRGSASSTAMFAAGELFWNFGWLGVMSGMCFLGLLLSGLWRMAGVDPRGQLLRMWLFVWLLYGLLEIPEASSALIGAVYTFLFFGGLTFLHTIARQTALKDSLQRRISRLVGSQRTGPMGFPGREHS